jgi:5'-deoxynucleotidase YfbR-like HD superfamily hydrolase
VYRLAPRGVAHAESAAEHTFGVAVLVLLISGWVTGLDRGILLALDLLAFALYAFDTLRQTF